VRVDQDVRQDCLAAAPGATVVGVGMTGEKACRRRDRLDDRLDGRDARKVSTRENRGAISASTTGLMISAPRWAAAVSCASDHASHLGSSGKTSIRTVLSTKFRAPGSTPGQREDLVGAQLDVPGATHPPDLARDPLAVDDQPCAAVVELEANLGPGVDSERPADLQRRIVT